MASETALSVKAACFKAILSRFSRWSFNFNLTASKDDFSGGGSRSKLKLHRLKPDGIHRTLCALLVALTFIISDFNPVLLIEANAFAAAPRQKQSDSTSKDRAAQGDQKGDDKSPTRPRTIAVRYASPDGPIIRVALMTDVNSVALSCSSGLVVGHSNTGFRETPKISSGSLRVELRQQSEPAAPLLSAVAEYRVSVGSSSESRGASKLADDLEKKFFEPVNIVFDEKQKKYAVLIGQFPSRSEAARMVDRLRKAGYDEPQIVTDPRAADKRDAPGPESGTDTNARAAKYKAQPSYASADRSSSPGRRPIRMVALAADRVSASSDDELIVAPSPAIVNRGKQPDSSDEDDRSGKDVARQDQGKSVASPSEIASAPAAVRVGSKDYRGEIRLVLNPRGKINVVNALPLEEYLRGVVPMELSPGGFPEIEALKAQAVAARSYALARMRQHRDEGFDLVDDTRAQVYGGLSVEHELSNRAIDQTRGIVAVYPNEDGKLAPIEALYTSNCGGRTENNEEVFGGKPLPYLRGVACSPDRHSLAGRDIVSNRIREPLVGNDGRSISREVALLSVLGFSLPRRATSHYLRGTPDQDEVRSWLGQTARLARRDKPGSTLGDLTRLADFARVVAASIYGEGRATTLLAPADVDYLLAGMRAEQLPHEARADVAMLLKDGILHLPAEGTLDGRAAITRGQAIETLARVIFLRSHASDLKSQASNLKSQISDHGFQISNLKSELAAAAEKGRLIIAPGSPGNVASRTQASRFTSVNTSGSGKLARPEQDETRQSKSPKTATDDIATRNVTTQAGSQRNVQAGGFEIADNAWLFRTVAGESYAVDRLTLIGGERVAYHLNDSGQVDFLEASISNRSASSDGFSRVAQWQERVTVEELQQRLARVRVNVGRLENIEPVAFSSSSRVTEVEVTGDEGRTRLRRPQIRGGLALKEYLFVADRETDARGRIVAFIFTGRGWGHGVGMCQTGAYGQAKDGHSYTAILQKYYTGVRLQKMY